MTQSPGQLPADSSPPPRSAQILPFEKPQTDLQRAVAARAQESMARSRMKPRPKPLKWLVVCLVALVPVLMLFGAVDGLLRMFHQLNETFIKQAISEGEAPAPPAAEAEEPATPGVVILQRPESVAPADQGGASSSTPEDLPPR